MTMAGGTGTFQAGTMLPGRLIDILKVGQEASPTIFTGATIAIASTDTAYSHSFPLPRGMTFGWEIVLTSSGVVAVTVELEEANQPPTTEGAQDDAFVIPVGKTTTNGLFPTGVVIATGVHYMVAYSPVAAALGRLKFTGTGANDAATVCSVARLYVIKNT